MTERPNIRRMQVPERGDVPKADFDPERDLSPVMWEAIVESFSTALHEGSGLGIAWTGSSIGVLDTSRSPEVSHELLRSIATARKNEADTTAFLLNFIRPRFDYEPTPEQISVLRERLQRDLENDSVSYVSAEIICALFLRSYSTISTSDVEGIRSRMARYSADRNFHNFAALAAMLRVIGEDVVVHQREWEGMHALLKSYHDWKNARLLAYLASKMKILAADEIRITEKGLEITMHKSDEKRKEHNKQLPDTLQI